VAEGETVPVEGWDFSWFEGRATEEAQATLICDGYSGRTSRPAASRLTVMTRVTACAGTAP
jgi:hypothetical protein